MRTIFAAAAFAALSIAAASFAGTAAASPFAVQGGEGAESHIVPAKYSCHGCQYYPTCDSYCRWRKNSRAWRRKKMTPQ